MLELPEVEVLRKDLEKEVVGKRVKDVTVETASIVRPFHRTRPEFISALEGRKIEGIRRRGTTIFLDLDDEDGTPRTWVLQAWGTASLHRETANEKPGEHTHLAVSFTIGGAIHLSDIAADVNASTGVVDTEGAEEAAEVSTDAFDPLGDSLTWMDFGQLLRDAAMPLKLLLIDPSRVLGIGPVYSDEILYEAGLRYDRSSETLSTNEIRRLYRSMHEVIATAMKFRGSSLDESDHDEAVDEEGEASEHLKVYGRDGLPSFRSRRPIEKVRVKKGIYSYFDPQSQV
ncbi:MAG: DNA-formamidopyrimidine glycosylase family protein [Actinomycetes bacterium]